MSQYSFADQVPLPNELGVKRSAWIGDVMTNIGAVNAYVDTIGFGEAAGIENTELRPLGVRYFMDTNIPCSNGANRWQYIDTIPKGDLMGKRVDKALSGAGLPRLRGLAPGIMEDARDALNPMPIFRAAAGGLSECELKTLPVGDSWSQIAGRPDDDGNKPQWVTGPVTYINNVPHQSHWVHKRYISEDEFDKEPKLYYPDGTRRPPPQPQEPFVNYSGRRLTKGQQLLAGAAVFGLLAGVAYVRSQHT
jgi:hypothetical protein